jgi:hypothetical protein
MEELENDNDKAVEITDQEVKDYLSDRFDQGELQAGNTRKKTTAEMLRDAERNR